MGIEERGRSVTLLIARLGVAYLFFSQLFDIGKQRRRKLAYGVLALFVRKPQLKRKGRQFLRAGALNEVLTASLCLDF
ncbi:MAG: hypothetical protein HY268_15620 [Deltaproteobacteria bacterium]|nr:hypothetical protein [Deltaproteobacteria bacterium]